MWLAFDDGLPIVRLSILGATGHGKTTLASAITKVFSETGQSEFVRYADIYGRFPCRCLYGDLTAYVSVKTAVRFYTFCVNRNRAAYLHDLMQSDHQDGAILVVSATDGVTHETREQVRLSRASGILAFVIYISKTDKNTDPDLLSVVELEAQSLLAEYSYADCNTVCGCAEWALNGIQNDIAAPSIHKLIDACNNTFRPPTADIDKPFLMPVEDTMIVTGRGTVATGRVVHGILKAGEPLEIVGIHEGIKTTVATSMEMFRKVLHSVQVGDNAGILLSDVERKDIERGQVLAAPGSIFPRMKFEAELYILSKKEGGYYTSRSLSNPIQFYFRTSDFTGLMQASNGATMVEPGDLLQIAASLKTPVALELYQRFALRDDGRTVGMGMVTKILK